MVTGPVPAMVRPAPPPDAARAVGPRTPAGYGPRAPRGPSSGSTSTLKFSPGGLEFALRFRSNCIDIDPLLPEALPASAHIVTLFTDALVKLSTSLSSELYVSFAPIVWPEPVVVALLLS